MGQATETVRTGGRQRQMWTVGRSCNETGRQTDRRDLEKMREMVEVGRQVPTAQEHRIIPMVSESFG